MCVGEGATKRAKMCSMKLDRQGREAAAMCIKEIFGKIVVDVE